MTGLSRRTAIGLGAVGIGALAAFGWHRLHPPVQDARWLAYKTRFFLPEGRIVDSGNGGISHSEGQGYGMLFAAAHGDRAAFDKLWQWTQTNLARPDGLHAWRYVPGATPPVADPNNASDGDLLMAWALVRAWRRWGDAAYKRDFEKLATVLKTAVVEDQGQAYLLPGVVGFTGDNTRVVNLSYWVFPALRALATETGDAVWTKVSDTGVDLIENAAFGPRHLPTDWLETSGTLRPTEKFPPRFGYDAVRVPLNLIWGSLATPQRLEAINAAWSSFTDGAPAWIDVVTDQVSPEKQSAGMHAVAQLTASVHNDRQITADALPPLDQATDYYSASLLMQTLLCISDVANHGV